MRPTPRVDAAAKRGSDLGMANMTWSGIWPLARILERELAEAVELLQSVTEALAGEYPEDNSITDLVRVNQAHAFLKRMEGK